MLLAGLVWAERKQFSKASERAERRIVPDGRRESGKSTKVRRKFQTESSSEATTVRISPAAMSEFLVAVRAIADKEVGSKKSSGAISGNWIALPKAGISLQHEILCIYE